MNYWLTIHWPFRFDERKNAAWRNWIFSAQGWQNLGKRIQAGDRVFIYETESAPRARVGTRLIGRRPGRKAIIALATITTPLRYKRTSTEILEDGRERRWSYRAQTHTDQELRLNLAELRNILRKPGFSARVPGGLMKLRDRQFNRILSRFSQGELF